MTAGRDAEGDRAVALRVEHLAKAYAGTPALDDVSFDVERGHIHALLGSNGSGKSTLVKILAGVVAADAGTIALNGERREATAFTPALARASGLRFVHQHSSTFAELSVAENLAAGHGFLTGHGGRIRWRALHEHAREVLARFEIGAEPGQPLATLGPATQMMVAIARALQDQEGADGGVLVLDEPTAALPAPQVELLLAALRRYAAAGQTIVYVTHRLEEVMRAADRATVLRDGRMVGSVAVADLDHDGLVELIVGGATARAERASQQERSDARTVLQVDGLRGGPVRDASFSLRAGEVVGIAGLVGSGRSSLLRLLFGERPREAGTVVLDGASPGLDTPARAMRAGIAYVPEDRIGEAAFMDLTVAENLAAANVGRHWRGGRLRHRAERRGARELMAAFAVKAPSLEAPLASLSGGNQQKVILARWLQRAPRVLLLDDPTQGVDVGARAEIYGLVRRAARDGAAVLMVSSDFDELAETCDRVLVLVGGRIVDEVDPATVDGDRLHQLAYGTRSVDGGA